MPKQAKRKSNSPDAAARKRRPSKMTEPDFVTKNLEAFRLEIEFYGDAERVEPQGDDMHRIYVWIAFERCDWGRPTPELVLTTWGDGSVIFIETSVRCRRRGIALEFCLGWEAHYGMRLVGVPCNAAGEALVSALERERKRLNREKRRRNKKKKPQRSRS